MALILVILLGVAVLWAYDVFQTRLPLGDAEVAELASRRHKDAILKKCVYSNTECPAHPNEKKAMNPKGEFLKLDLAYYSMPARMAGFLKYKKHEWIIYVFLRDFRATELWWNKGADKSTVTPHLQGAFLRNALRHFKPDMVAVLHNHPNPDPSRYCCAGASEQDYVSARELAGTLQSEGISLLEFVCERGLAHLYFASLSLEIENLGAHVSEIRSRNGHGIFKNRALRKELQRSTSLSYARVETRFF